ncbi:hypothetical protein M3Y97_00722400 [Aphelenchoides bicaudatus]|nr:hypothetical protein M3Y97_00722400 [Aphelenchoides bicaudatus]
MNLIKCWPVYAIQQRVILNNNNFLIVLCLEEPQQLDGIKMEDIKPDQFLDIEMQKISKRLLIEDNKPEDEDEKTLEVQQSASGQVQKTKKSDFKKAKSIPPLMLKTNKSYEIQRRMVPLRKSVPSTPKTPTFQSTTVIQESPSSGSCNCDFLFENWRLRSKMMKATSIKTSSFSLKCKKYRRKSTSK